MAAKLRDHNMEVGLMNREQFYILILITVVLLSMRSVCAVASVVHYSWSGNLVPSGSDDPWQLGPQGQPFVLEVAISLDAPDLLDLNVEFAAFELDDASLLLDNQQLTFVGNGNIDFTDDWSGLLDLVVFHGDFERLGQIIEIGSAVSLPTSTYAFTQMIESPPHFASTENVDRTTCCGGTYTSIVALGSPVSAVPEPSTAFLLGVSIIPLFASLRSRFSRFASI